MSFYYVLYTVSSSIICTGDINFLINYKKIYLLINEDPRLSWQSKWLTFRTCYVGGMGSIPGRRTKVPHAVWSGQKTEGQYEHSTMEAKPLWDIKTFKRGRNCLRTKDGTGCAGCLLKCFFLPLFLSCRAWYS